MQNGRPDPDFPLFRLKALYKVQQPQFEVAWFIKVLHREEKQDINISVGREHWMFCLFNFLYSFSQVGIVAISELPDAGRGHWWWTYWGLFAGIEWEVTESSNGEFRFHSSKLEFQEDIWSPMGNCCKALLLFSSVSHPLSVQPLGTQYLPLLRFGAFMTAAGEFAGQCIYSVFLTTCTTADG